MYRYGTNDTYQLFGSLGQRWFDEIASISVAYQKVSKHITPEIEAKVDAILDRWFPEYAEFDCHL